MSGSKLFVIASVVCVVACSDATSPFSDVNVQIVGITQRTRDAYAIVSFTVTNTSSHVVYLTRCGDRLMTSVERQVGTVWMEYSGDLCDEVYPNVPLSLDPGATVQGTRGVGDVGTFRLHVGIATASDTQPDWTSVTSDAFGLQ